VSTYEDTCLDPVRENLFEIVEIIGLILKGRDLHFKEMFIYGSRAVGSCRPDSDIDIYVQLETEHTSLVNRIGGMQDGVKVIPPRFFADIKRSDEIHGRARKLNLDMRAGISAKPPQKPRYKGMKYYINFKDLRQMETHS